MGMLSEDRTGEGLATNLNIADNMTLTRLEGPRPAAFSCRRHGSGSARAHVDRAARISARRVTAQEVARLSGGNQQKVALARLLHHDVDVLVLDEPTRGIDVAQQSADLQADRRARVRSGRHPGRAGSRASGSSRTRKAVLIVSSYFPELLALCDRIAVMSRGRLGAPRPASEWTEHALVLEASGAPHKPVRQ